MSAAGDYYWQQLPTATGSPMLVHYTKQTKYCGGLTKCGKPCHKGINLQILKRKYDDGGNLIYGKIYCKECDEVFESDMKPCETIEKERAT